MSKQHLLSSYESPRRMRQQYTEKYVFEQSVLSERKSNYVSFEELDKQSDLDDQFHRNTRNSIPRKSASVQDNNKPCATAPETLPVSHPGVVENLTQFLLKKDLLMSRFSPFNDRPDSYQTWKASFTSIVKELNISAFEEMDLLIKWLGPDSKRFASSIRKDSIVYGNA